uniref:G_PROTEIN_RECEP_F2_3 domain-containing protein n=1 Tax=Macrostomum lignano TaxID=282301 RepID=A0A1I8JQC2_9PLAT
MNSAFFVTTNVVITKNQSQTTCEEDKDNKWHAKQRLHQGHVHGLGWGVRTGRCLNSTREEGLRICEIYGWPDTRWTKYCPIFRLGDIIKYGQAISPETAKQVWITGGRGGKFDVLNFTMNLGSGLALLTLATVLCDIIVLNIMRKKK